jgi:hypothetical protein
MTVIIEELCKCTSISNPYPDPDPEQYVFGPLRSVPKCHGSPTLGGLYIFSESFEERGSAIWLRLRDSSTLCLQMGVLKNDAKT